MVKYTMEHLEQARAALERVEDKWARDTSGNSDKYRGQIIDARREVEEIEAALKRQGLIPYSEKERLNNRLDEAFPCARSREIVEFEGARYIKKFYPKEKSRSGKSVKVWGSYWLKLD